MDRNNKGEKLNKETWMNDTEKKEIIELLQKKGAMQSCPRCSNTNFELIDGYLNQYIQNEFRHGMAIGGPSIPSVVVVCNKCGFMSQHALGALNLLSPKRKEGE